MKKRVLSFILATVAACSLASTTVSAAEATVPAAEKVYTTTVTLSPTPYSNPSYSKTLSTGISLAAGKSGWAPDVSVSFIGIPANALVQKIEVVHGTATSSGGPVLATKLRLISPNGKSGELIWGKTMTDDSKFFYAPAKGTWKVSIYGTNLAKPTGNPMIDGQYTGMIGYKNMKMTITYILE